jgi:hypothetical protein
MIGEDHPLLGKWRITSMELWDAAFIDLLGQGFIRVAAERSSEFSFGAIQGALDCQFGSHSIYFTWEGTDEMEHVRGDGDAEIEDDGTISGEIRFHNGDETTFTARRW